MAISKKSSVYIETRPLRPSKKHPKGKNKYYVFSEVKGVKRSHGGYDTSRDAKAKKAVIISQIASDTFMKPQKKNPAYRDHFNLWIQGKKKSLSPSASYAYQSSHDLYILPFFRNRMIRDISRRDVQDFINSLGSLSANYVRTIYAHLRVCLNAAVDDGIIDSSPCRKIDLPKVPRVRKEYLGPTDAWSLIDSRNGTYNALFAILVLSGIRIGEALALKLKCIDFKEGKIRISETWDTRARILHQPKSAAAIRSVEMLSCLSEILDDFVRESGIQDPEAFLFPSPMRGKDQPLSYPTVNQEYRNAVGEQALPNHKIHSLRHSFASIMIAAGVSIPTISRNLGHSSPVITMHVYGHEIQEMVGPALDCADELFREARS